MLIQGSAVSNRTDKLIEQYDLLLKQGVSSANILVLCLNAYKKSEFIRKFKEKTKNTFYENPKIYTFSGFVYNTILDNWPLIENANKLGNCAILPNLTGLEISELFFKSAIKEIGFKDYNSKINLIHQLFRRYSLITYNNLNEKEIAQRSEILNESFGDDAQKAIELYKRKTLEYRAFDYIRQLSLFQYILEHTNYLQNFEYLIIDDGDEITPLEFDFIKQIKPNLKETYIGYDCYGTSRIGFLNADSKTVDLLEELFKEHEKINCDSIEYKPIKVSLTTCSRRLEMINNVLKDVMQLISNGVKPSEIAIVTPILDNSLKRVISETFKKNEIEFQLLSGNEKLVSTTLVKCIISILKMSIGINVDIKDVKLIISDILKIPIKNCMKVISTYKQDGLITSDNLCNETHTKKMNDFIDVLEEISSENMPLSEKIFYIIKNLISPDKSDLAQMKSLSFFVKQIQDFETVFKEHKTNTAFLNTILTQLENSIISENPTSGQEINNDAVIISTVQKLIDYSLSTNYQIWLDVSSSEWVKDDLGTIYNAWVLQKSWNKNEFTYEDNIELIKIKTKRQLRKLSLLGKNIQAYSSFFDIEGNENIGGIEDYFDKETTQEKKQTDYRFTPREDQKEILNYTSGKMSISAVPGAGKTTVLLALIVKLLNNSINSENIFVLTYMDSAARNFKERIKIALPTLEKLPNISTIHGLALRILKENSNYTRIGLNENFEVCDDNARQKIIRESMLQLRIEQDDYDKYEKGISALKLSGANKLYQTKDNEINKFLKLFDLYNTNLQKYNFIDYDDMLVLSVKLLETNKDICEYYQNICKYVIEDEAQDSSFIQQKLLNQLSGKHKNLIRCGDINQSITTTFTNADLDGFKEFINHSNSLSMNKSQRCAKEIYTFANKLIEYTKSTKELNNAFFEIKMSGVEGKNPVSPNALTLKSFEDYTKELNYITQQIREAFKQNPNTTVAILVRNNYQVEDYSKALSERGYNIITRNDTLSSQPVFVTIYNILQFCAHPWDNSYIYQTMTNLNKQNISQFDNEELDFVKNLKTPFITLEETEINSKKLTQLYWDLNYWLKNSMEDTETFVAKIGNYYYTTEIELSNVYMVGLLLKNLNAQYKNSELLLDKLEELMNRPILSKYKFFENENTNNTLNGAVQIMTYHKSKGDEFDYVFIPELNEENLPFETNSIKIKSKERFLESIKALNLNYIKKDEYKLKKFIVEENLRLLYVAITRAKKKLYITCANKYKKFSKIKNIKQSLLFDIFSDYIEV